MKLEQFFLDSGYRRISLSRNNSGHFQVAGTLNGQDITVLVDTGAGASLVDVVLARELKLPMEKLPITGGGAGGVNLEIFRVSHARLTVADTTPKLESLMAMDLSQVNEGLACKGCEQGDAILGADVFDAQSAVIDYGSSSLYLKE